jgi:hypothetical protein
MALDDVFKVTDYQRLPSGEEVLNVYFYQRLDPAGDAADLLAVFVSDLAADVKAVQSNELVHRLYRVENLGDLADFDEYSLAGDVGGQGAGVRNEWDAWAYTLRPSTRAVRPGSKRIAGVPEGDGAYTNGVVVNAAMLILLQALRVQLSALLVGTLAQYQPVIVKRVLDGTTYRLPETTLELVAVPVSQALFNTKISHQVSRGNNR